MIIKRFYCAALSTALAFTLIACAGESKTSAGAGHTGEAAAFQKSRLGKIAILSFSGGTEDEREGIAELLSFTPEIMDHFMVIPRTTITSAVKSEQQFQLSGMTDSDTMARLGAQFGADYVMAGSITSLGQAHLLIVAVVKISTIQEVAGDFITYNTLDDFNRDETILDKMAGNIIALMGKKTKPLDKLAVLPVHFMGNVNKAEGDALAQLLSIYLIQDGKYAVYPRTKTLEQVEKEYKTQLSGVTNDDEAVALGHAVNPPYVLSVVSRKIGSMNRFNASIIDLSRGNQVGGESEKYTGMSEGMNVMKVLAGRLSNGQ
jgi:hypothetical protein